MYLVKTDFIQEKQSIVLDCRYDMTNPSIGQEVYRKGHLKGAFYVDLDRDMTSELRTHGGRHPLKDLEVFSRLMGSYGVQEDSVVLIYDDGEFPMASRLWYMLRLIGLEQVFILDGGYPAIQAAGLEITTEVPDTISAVLKIRYQLEIIADMEDTKAAQNNPKAIIVDSRASERYAGLEEPFDRIAGRIPTAVNYFWKDIFKSGEVRDYGEIEAHFLEMTHYDDIIVHCGSGITGCVNLFFMNEVGINARLYLGSYSDWISYDNNDVVIKDNQTIKAKA